ncbi:DoxX family protein [Sphingobacterium composti Ten et al. 2007 non Yoo et al. 2007]|uniref:DoxX family protein n=1 Tax=Sphingobacterium composti TaxID=363260 RepID=UPI001357A6C5|nr:DoxX family protein [Sphingobacterium composti Ten et al. 2007 non Yoo et al. 2007]
MSRSSRSHKRDIGILIIRVVIGGCMLLFHGLPKLINGPEVWEKVGAAMGNIGITFWSSFWGFAATMTESVGALLIMVGLFTKHTSLVLAFTMLIATISHLSKGDTWAASSHSIELMAVFIALYFTGAGKFSIDKK